MDVPDLPDPARTEFEKYRLAADTKLLEQIVSNRYLHVSEALAYLDGMLEKFAEVVFSVGAEECWSAEKVRVKLEAGLHDIVLRLVQHHRIRLVGFDPKLKATPELLVEHFMRPMEEGQRWRGILRRIAALADKPLLESPRAIISNSTPESHKGNSELGGSESSPVKLQQDASRRGSLTAKQRRELSERADKRTRWLDSKLEGRSDGDLTNTGKIAYNTIQKYRSGVSTNQIHRTRRGLCDALNLLKITTEFSEVPE